MKREGDCASNGSNDVQGGGARLSFRAYPPGTGWIVQLERISYYFLALSPASFINVSGSIPRQFR